MFRFKAIFKRLLQGAAVVGLAVGLGTTAVQAQTYDAAREAGPDMSGYTYVPGQKWYELNKKGGLSARVVHAVEEQIGKPLCKIEIHPGHFISNLKPCPADHPMMEDSKIGLLRKKSGWFNGEWAYEMRTDYADVQVAKLIQQEDRALKAGASVGKKPADKPIAVAAASAKPKTEKPVVVAKAEIKKKKLRNQIAAKALGAKDTLVAGLRGAIMPEMPTTGAPLPPFRPSFDVAMDLGVAADGRATTPAETADKFISDTKDMAPAQVVVAREPGEGSFIGLRVAARPLEGVPGLAAFAPKDKGSAPRLSGGTDQGTQIAAIPAPDRMRDGADNRKGVVAGGVSSKFNIVAANVTREIAGMGIKHFVQVETDDGKRVDIALDWRRANGALVAFEVMDNGYQRFDVESHPALRGLTNRVRSLAVA
ncbi:MAG: hypothetical protein H6865_03760 [Rhodospirillales bacterium]|nr:hypothetical protein [Alphaproteobacteria bacterium]MCB9986733.1 hypothetical protein [Rhodospirillales bacterium]USO08498.1 MAG: hypothetical protein H6866_04625 [Rhodospirillales bacterium]